MKDQGASNLWVVDVEGERLRQLTDGTFRDCAPVWSPDGKRIAFLSNRSGSSQIHVMWVDTRETLQLTRLEREPSGLTWSPDGSADRRSPMNLPDETPILPVKLPETPKGAQLAQAAPSSSIVRSGARTAPARRQGLHARVRRRRDGRRHAAAGDDRQLQPHARRPGPPDGKTIYRLRHPQAGRRVPAWRLRDLRRRPGHARRDRR